MSKGIAVNTILYFLIGIIVVGIVIYLVYTYVLGPPIGEQECRSLAITWCTACKNVQDDTTNWDDAGIGATKKLKDCASTYFGATIEDCDTADEMNFCSGFIPV